LSLGATSWAATDRYMSADAIFSPCFREVGFPFTIPHAFRFAKQLSEHSEPRAAESCRKRRMKDSSVRRRPDPTEWSALKIKRYCVYFPPFAKPRRTGTGLSRDDRKPTQGATPESFLATYFLGRKQAKGTVSSPTLSAKGAERMGPQLFWDLSESLRQFTLIVKFPVF
jgi:hypothetical protein